MRKILVSMSALLIAISFSLGGDIANFAGHDGTMVLAQDTKNPPPSPAAQKAQEAQEVGADATGAQAGPAAWCMRSDQGPEGCM
jgi:hypothetical protein